MFDDVETKLKKGNQILFNKDSKCIEELVSLLNNTQKKVLILWVFDVLVSTIKEFEKIDSIDKRPHIAIEKCREWSYGNIKMPEAKKAILECHAVARETTNKEKIALVHAIGQGVSVVHVKTHALGLIYYELTEIVLRNKDNYQQEVVNKINYYKEKLDYINNNIDINCYKWASFLNY